jgi:hypothetical protein
MSAEAPPWARSNFYALETSSTELTPRPVHCSRVQMDLAWFLLSALGMSAGGKLTSIPDTSLSSETLELPFNTSMMSRASCPHSQTYRVQLSLWDHVQRLTTTTLIFLRDCVECLLLHQGKPDNQTCHHQCKDEVITWVDTIGECPAELWTAVSLDLVRHLGFFSFPRE